MKRVCSDCIGEAFLQQLVLETGDVTPCDYCRSERNPTLDYAELAERVHLVLTDHFQMTSPDPEGIDYLAAKYGNWEQPGEPITDVIMNLIGSSEDLAEAVRDYLSGQYDPAGKEALSSPCLYASDSQYEERPIDTYPFQESWTSFRREVLSRSRFFNQSAKSALDYLFLGVADLVTHSGEPVVRTLRPDDGLFRARLAKSYDGLVEILKFAPESLGAPPSGSAAAGRMNAEGIPVFYGATELSTCIAEIRAPVGSHVVTATFYPLNDLRVLDLTALRQVFLQGSLFDPEHTESLSRVDFLKRLEAELSQPVLPGEESRAYVPTQVAAEYLSAHPDMNLDGVMFTSSQAGDEEVDGSDSSAQKQAKNLVLFSEACRLQCYERPADSKIDVNYYHGDPEDPDPCLVIWDSSPSVKVEDADELVSDHTFTSWCPDSPNEELKVECHANIRLDLDSIKVWKIRGVRYQTSLISVSRYRREDEADDF